MSLRQTIAEESKPALKGPPCTVSIVLTQLDKDDVAALQEALADPRVTGSAICRALEKEGHRVPPHSLNRHRRGICNCGN